ncbi:YeiH family protein [Gellertiella hungarica]|nr:putative sulfate exporter family transporter [Gellertiella hungarica]
MEPAIDDRPEKRSVPALSRAIEHYGPGLLVTAAVAMAAQFLAEHYGAPAMLMALLLGIAFHFLSEEGRCVAGIELSAKKVLRVGVALLGMRISVDLLIQLGAETILLLVAGLAATILFGLLLSRLLRLDWRLSLLTAGAVAICGASAAMAIAAVLPRGRHSERNLLVTVLGVTVMSTIAMIAYPILAHRLGLSDRATGIFFGGTIHDVAQVVGAGFSVSQTAGETATLVKLIRVTMLAPVVLCFSLVLRNMPADDPEIGAKRPPLLPGFVIAFLILAAINSAGWIPAALSTAGLEVSRWALLAGIVAVGMKTSLKNLFEAGRTAIGLIVAETIFIAIFILTGLSYLDLG